jgi:hypothetical protein
MIENVMMKVHPDFKALVKDVQRLRVLGGKEDFEKPMSLDKLTKTITNMISSNPTLIKMLLEVEING